MMESVALVVLAIGASYSYVLYPLALIAIATVRSSPASSAPTAGFPSVSLIITAYNEEGRIRAKLENSLAIDYPNLEVIVASDCSTDSTDHIVREFAGRGVELVRAPERRGKEFAQQCAIRKAAGEILVFSDTSTRIEPDSVARMVGYFADPRVGAVSSEDRFEDEAGFPVGEGAYLRYEMWLRRLESSVSGLVGLSGSFFAARRQVVDPWDIETPSDFNVALNCARAGMQAVSARDVIGYYKDLKNPEREYQRKVRTVLRGMNGLARHSDVLRPWRYGLFAWQVFSHKLMRWLAPLFLLALLIVSAWFQSRDGILRALFAVQMGFYVTAALAWRFAFVRAFGPARLAYFFCQVNLAVLHAGLHFAAGRQITSWQPSAR